MSLYINRQDKGLQQIPQKDFADEGYEEHLEDILERTPFIPDGEKILIIGRQVLTNYGERIDLLGLNEDGDAIVIELKRGKTPREVIAQTLGYAAWVNNSGYEELHAIAKKYYLEKNLPFTSLLAAYKARFGVGDEYLEESEETAREWNKKQKMFIIAQEIDEQLADVARFLRKNEIDISCIQFTYHVVEGGEAILNTEWIVGRERLGEVKKELPHGPGKYDDFFQMFEKTLLAILSSDNKPSYLAHYARKNYAQIRYPGFGSRHFELRFLKNKYLEVALHNEPGKADHFLETLSKKNKRLLREQFGDEMKIEHWGQHWERMYLLMPLKPNQKLDEVLATKAAKRMKEFIEVVRPLVGI